jgi:voltage-gated potassium channel
MDLRRRLRIIIFGTETRAGRIFDQILLLIIVLSVLVALLDSSPRWYKLYHDEFYTAEWLFTIIFCLEYILRILVSAKPIKYIFSFWGIIDLLAVIPTLISPFVTGYETLLIIRSLRLLRIFRVMKLSRFSAESSVLYHSLKASSYKITVFLFFVLMMAIISGTIMYVVEGAENGFDSIPQGIYWSIVTLTTVGYGDISPVTPIGKIIASVMMITGYGIIAIPTGLITVEMSRHKRSKLKHCTSCDAENGEQAVFCDQCGSKLEE